LSKRLPRIKAKKIIKALEKLGFIIKRQKGSHVHLYHPYRRKFTVVPLHSKDVGLGLLLAIIKQAEISKDDLLNNI